MNYKSALSNEERILNQYSGFLETTAVRFWSEAHIESFPFPVKGKPAENISVVDNTVLGKRAEVFFEAMLAHSAEYRVVASQIQLINDGITEGEFDFFVEEVSINQLIHIELAYKIYLLDGEMSTDQSQWVGPNRRDSLKLKWTKLINNQFPKLASPSAVDLLHKMGFENPSFRQALCMPMQLFIPFWKSEESMGDLAPCYSGRWISFVEFTRQDWQDDSFFIPEKEDWFVNPDKCEIWMSKTDIFPSLSEIIESSRSPMVWRKPKYGSAQRMFVTFW